MTCLVSPMPCVGLAVVRWKIQLGRRLFRREGHLEAELAQLADRAKLCLDRGPTIIGTGMYAKEESGIGKRYSPPAPQRCATARAATRLLLRHRWPGQRGTYRQSLEPMGPRETG